MGGVKNNVGWSVSKVKVTHGGAESKDRGPQGQSHETSNYVNGKSLLKGGPGMSPETPKCLETKCKRYG